jgi:hypothetical protein
MTLAEIQKLLKAESFTDFDHQAETEIETACGSDLLSDVLAFTKEKTLLLTGLVNLQVLRTVEMLDLVGVVFVRGKEPTQEMIELSREHKIPLLSTSLPMYEACGILFNAGLKGDGD